MVDELVCVCACRIHIVPRLAGIGCRSSKRRRRRRLRRSRKEIAQRYRDYFVPFVVEVVLELLRVRHERPNRCRTNKTHEVAPPHVPPRIRLLEYPSLALKDRAASENWLRPALANQANVRNRSTAEVKLPVFAGAAILPNDCSR